MTDWGYLLHETEKHTPHGPEWFMHKPNINHTIPDKQKYRVGLNGCYIEMYLIDARWEEDDAQEASANQALICAAPKFREEVIRLREGIWGIIKNAESAIGAGSEHSEAFRFIAQELRELVE